MTTAAIVEYLVKLGFSLHLRGEKLIVRPKPPQRVSNRLRARKSEIVAYLREQDPDALHAFTAVAAADVTTVCEYGVCIACGVPWSMHSEPTVEAWRLVENANDVTLVDPGDTLEAYAESTVAFDEETSS